MAGFHAVAGGLASLVSTATLYPVDTVRTRMQSAISAVFVLLTDIRFCSPKRLEIHGTRSRFAFDDEGGRLAELVRRHRELTDWVWSQLGSIFRIVGSSLYVEATELCLFFSNSFFRSLLDKRYPSEKNGLEAKKRLLAAGGKLG